MTQYLCLTCVHRDGPAATRRVWRQGAVPGGEGAGDGSGAGSTQRKRVHHLCGARQPQLTGKWRRMWPFFKFLNDTKCYWTTVLCCRTPSWTSRCPYSKGPENCQRSVPTWTSSPSPSTSSCEMSTPCRRPWATPSDSGLNSSRQLTSRPMRSHLSQEREECAATNCTMLLCC